MSTLRPGDAEFFDRLPSWYHEIVAFCVRLHFDALDEPAAIDVVDQIAPRSHHLVLQATRADANEKNMYSSSATNVTRAGSSLVASVGVGRACPYPRGDTELGETAAIFP